MKLYTTKEIADKLKIERQTVLTRFNKKGIKGKKRGAYFFYTQTQFDMIRQKKSFKPSLPNYSNPNNYLNQIIILNYYFKDIPYKEIAYLVGVNYHYVFNIIGTYKRNDNFLIVQSKMNY